MVLDDISAMSACRGCERFRDSVQTSIEMAVAHALTGLHTAVYMQMRFSTLVGQPAARGKPLTALVFNVDHFKEVDDDYRQDAGDAALRVRDQAPRNAAAAIVS